MPRPSRILNGLLLAVALSALAAVAALVLGYAGRFHAGSATITLNDYRKPLLAGVIAATALLVQNWASLPRRFCVVLMLAALAVLGAANFAVTLPPITTASDLAVTELYTELATRGRLLVGPYSRFGWHHPGPLYFYLQAPLYALAGHKAAALYAGALLLNLGALFTMVWVAFRENPRVAVAIAGACLGLAWRLPRFLASPWTAHVPIMPAMAVIVLCAAIAGGRVGLLPIAVLCASFAFQTHLAVGPAIALIVVALLAHLGWRARNGVRMPGRPLAASACVAMFVWVFTVSEAVAHGGGNLAALWRFFASEAASGQSVWNAAAHWSYGLTGLLRPDVELPWGSRITLAHLGWGMPVAAAQMLLLAGIARADFRAGRLFEAHLALASLLTSGIGILALTRIQGEIRDHEIFWLSACGTMNVAVIANAAARVFRIRAPGGGLRAAAAPACALLVAACVAIGVWHLRDLTAYELRRPERTVTLLAHEAISAYLLEQGLARPLIMIDGGVWSEATGVILRLYQRDVRFRIGEPAGPMFAPLQGRTGDEDAVIHITRAGRHEQLRTRPANRVLLESHPVFINAVRLPPVRFD